MRIKNLSAQTFHLGFVNYGIRLYPAGDSEGRDIKSIDDKYASNYALIKAVNAGQISILDYDIDDVSNDQSSIFNNKSGIDFVTQKEFIDAFKGLYVITTGWSSTGTPTATATAARIDGAVVSTPYDFTKNYILKLKFDGLDSQIVQVELPRGVNISSAVVNALNGDANFTKYGVASYETDHFRIVSRALGTNSNVEVLPHQLSVDEILGLNSVTLTAGTQAFATVEIISHGPSGVPFKGFAFDIKLYQGDSPSTTVSTEFQVQRPQVGVINSGLYTAEFNASAGNEGKIVFEVVAPGAITQECWVAVVPKATDYYATVPPAYLQVI